MRNLLYLLELEYLHNLYEKEIDCKKKLYVYPEINVVYTPDIVTMNVLAFHLKTNLFFIHNNNIFELVCEYLYDKNYYRYAGFSHNLLDSFKYCLENVTQDLNFYFSDKYFTLNTNQYYEFQSKFNIQE